MIQEAVILAGGMGSRLSEETTLKPKPMVAVGGKPILWHIMSRFALFGVKRFVVCLGYKSEVIKDYFSNFSLFNCDVEVSIANKQVRILGENDVDWVITLAETGEKSNTGERLRRVKKYISGDDFFFTYGDGLTNQDLKLTYDFHLLNEKKITLTAVNPPARYGAIETDGSVVTRFMEKSYNPDSLVNGGYFVVNRSVFDEIERYANPSWEFDILPNVASQGDLVAFEHKGFWFAMDTIRDKEYLEGIWQKGNAPWLEKSN